VISVALDSDIFLSWAQAMFYDHGEARLLHSAGRIQEETPEEGVQNQEFILEEGISCTN